MPPDSTTNGTGTTTTGTTTTPTAPALPEELRAAFRQFAEDAKLATPERKTFHQNLKLRHANQLLRAEVDQLKASGPKEGQVVLSKEDAAVFADFQKLNVKPADVTAALTERDTLKSKETERARDTLFADAAEALGFANTPLFVRTMQNEKLHVEFKDVMVENEDGEREKVRLPYARPAADDKKELVALDEYLEQEFGTEMIAALQAEPASEDDEGADSDEETGMPIRRTTTSARRPTTRASQEPVRGVRMPVTRGARPTGSTPTDKKRQQKIIDEVRSSLRVRI